MTNRFVTYLGSKPKSAATVILTLVVALVLVSAGLALELMPIGRKPYPSQNITIKLVNDMVIYTQNSTTVIENETPVQSFPYSNMKIVFRVSFTTDFRITGFVQMGSTDFGNQTILNAGHNATVQQVLMTSSICNVSIDIRDSTGDGSFDDGDTISYDIVPLTEDLIYTTGLFWGSPDHRGAMATEFSFALHDGKLYTWYSSYLNDVPWYEPLLGH